MTRKLINAARRALSDYLRIKHGETVLLIFDESASSIAAAFRTAADNAGIALTARQIEPTGGHGREPDPESTAMMRQYDVLIAPTRFSLTHTDAARSLVAAGGRVATLPGITDSLFVEGLAVDPLELRLAGEFWRGKLANSRHVRVFSHAGTNLSFQIGQYPVMNDDGIIDQPGIFGNLPAGETFLAPNPDSAEGCLVIDGSIGGLAWQNYSSPAKIIIKNGKIVDFPGQSSTDINGKMTLTQSAASENNLRGRELAELLLPYGNSALMLAEFGIGTHPGLKMSGNLLGDEKLKGTIHLAFGNNCSMGGENNVPVHIDGLVLKPSVEFDGKTVIKDGQWQ